MSISMIGIDYKKASVDVRAQFSFTKKNTVCMNAKKMEEFKQKSLLLSLVGRGKGGTPGRRNRRMCFPPIGRWLPGEGSLR